MPYHYSQSKHSAPLGVESLHPSYTVQWQTHLTTPPIQRVKAQELLRQSQSSSVDFIFLTSRIVGIVGGIGEREDSW